MGKLRHATSDQHSIGSVAFDIGCSLDDADCALKYVAMNGVTELSGWFDVSLCVTLSAGVVYVMS